MLDLSTRSSEVSATLMTSDRGNSGEAELTYISPVTPKSLGLNPNATVFLSKSPQEPVDGPTVSALTHGLSPPPDTNVPMMPLDTTPSQAQWDDSCTDDMPKSEDGLVFPPTPESPTMDYIDVQPTPDLTPPPALPPIQTVFIVENGTGESPPPSEANLSDDQLRLHLKNQLEYYFSRENLASDAYLVSQMDADQYVPIATVANFNQVQRLTNNLELIVNVLREAANVQVDARGEKVRPNHNRCIVILREVPQSTPVQDVENLFTGPKCPKFVSCEFAHNNNWYITFDSDEDAQKAYQFLREEVHLFLGKPIMARIKAKPLVRTSFGPRNGYKMQQFADQPPQQQPAPPPQQQQQQPQQTYPQVQRYAIVSNIPYMNGQQPFQPFYPPAQATPVVPSWPTSPTILEPSMVFAMNGYQATGVKLNSTASRHGFQNMRNRAQKPHRPINQDRNLPPDSHLAHDRHPVNLNSNHRTSPRISDPAQMSNHAPFHGRREPMMHPVVHPQVLDPNAGASLHINGRPSDAAMMRDLGPQSQRKTSYKSRRRRGEEETARGLRPSPSQIPTKDPKYKTEPQFELEQTSFPPLPGSSNNASSGEIFESKLSDVVKGTARLQTKDVKILPVSALQVQTTPPIAAQPCSQATSSIPPATHSQSCPQRSESPPSREDPTQVANHTGSSSSGHCTPPTPPASPQRVPKSNSCSMADTKQNETVHRKQAVISTQGKMDDTPVKLSYAQMVVRRKDSDQNGDSLPLEDGAMELDAPRNLTLREQSQQTTVRNGSANSCLQPKEQRKDADPRDSKHNIRRAKENRERKEHRRDRDEQRPLPQ